MPAIRTNRRLWVSLLAVAALVTLGVALIVLGTRDHGGSAHAQPLPEHPFAIEPAAARALPDPGGSTGAGCQSHPARAEVEIAALCISAPLVTTRADASGSLPVPADVSTVAQDLDTAALTARRGSTVIAGHVDDANQGDGAFYALYRTRPGTQITVAGLDGTVTTWKVFKVTAVRKDRLPEDIFATTGPRQLVLVTCGGALQYQPGYGNTYADNVLVYATPAARA